MDGSMNERMEVVRSWRGIGQAVEKFKYKRDNK